MQFRRLGRDGPEISVVGVGAWAIGGPWRFGWGPVDDEESVAAIRRAIDEGLNWIDTAAVYGLGHSEEVVGQALRGHATDHEVFERVEAGVVAAVVRVDAVMDLGGRLPHEE